MPTPKRSAGPGRPVRAGPVGTGVGARGLRSSFRAVADTDHVGWPDVGHAGGLATGAAIGRVPGSAWRGTARGCAHICAELAGRARRGSALRRPPTYQEHPLCRHRSAHDPCHPRRLPEGNRSRHRGGGARPRPGNTGPGALVAPAAAGAESRRGGCGGVVLAGDDGPHRGRPHASTVALRKGWSGRGPDLDAQTTGCAGRSAPPGGHAAGSP